MPTPCHGRTVKPRGHRKGSPFLAATMERSRLSAHNPAPFRCLLTDKVTSVHRPSAASGHHDLSPRVLVHLPRGPLWGDEELDAINSSQLTQNLPSHHIVRINYRVSPQHPYPGPVHDTLAGYDWILENILPKRAISRPGRADHVGRIAVCGELIGGGLASMLALTECRIGEPGIWGAAVNNPIVDWVSLDEAARRFPETDPDGDSPAQALMDLRRSLFPKPDKYFDTFASPLLFFRTPGVSIPPTPADVPLDDMELLSLHEREEHDQQMRLTDPEDVHDQTAADLLLASTTPRKSSRRFPSASLNLRLPQFHITSGAIQPFASQAEELTHLLRQSFVRQARQTSSGSSFGRKLLLDGERDRFEDEREKEVRMEQEAEAREKAVLGRSEGLGLWDRSTEGKERLAVAAKWIAEKTG